MSQPLVVSASVTLAGEDLSWSAVRSSGPGGQNVNKVASKVELRFDPTGSKALSEAVRDRLLHLARGRLDATGQVIVVSERTRDQHRNLEDAREKLRALVLAALVEPTPRKATKPSRSAKRRRLADKRHQADKRRARTVDG